MVNNVVFDPVSSKGQVQVGNTASYLYRFQLEFARASTRGGNDKGKSEGMDKRDENDNENKCD